MAAAGPVPSFDQINAARNAIVALAINYVLEQLALEGNGLHSISKISDKINDWIFKILKRRVSYLVYSDVFYGLTKRALRGLFSEAYSLGASVIQGELVVLEPYRNDSKCILNIPTYLQGSGYLNGFDVGASAVERALSIRRPNAEEVARAGVGSHEAYLAGINYKEDTYALAGVGKQEARDSVDMVALVVRARNASFNMDEVRRAREHIQELFQKPDYYKRDLFKINWVGVYYDNLLLNFYESRERLRLLLAGAGAVAAVPAAGAAVAAPPPPPVIATCDICEENFDGVRPIVRTPCCKHYYHRTDDCLTGHLKRSETCPNCRRPLTLAELIPVDGPVYQGRKRKRQGKKGKHSKKRKTNKKGKRSKKY
jgi:hypothetical protein